MTVPVGPGEDEADETVVPDPGDRGDACDDGDVDRHGQHHQPPDLKDPRPVDPRGLDQFERRRGMDVAEDQREDRQAEQDMDQHHGGERLVDAAQGQRVAPLG